jgi:IMP dehydrogenase
VRKLFTFDDVLIVPKFSSVRSRRDVDISTGIGGIRLNLPIVSSNMATVTESAMARKMSELGGLAFLHRFCSIGENVAMYKQSTVNNLNASCVGASIGIDTREGERAEALIGAGCRIICIDVAHGAQDRVAGMLIWLKQKYPNIATIVGNFGSGESLSHFINELAAPENYPDAVKVGIGSGAACTTRLKTGIGVPQFSAISECSKFGIPVIADGGCRKPADVCKALAAGASAVMLGFMLAGTEESPGKVNAGLKTYAGSAAGGYAEGWKTSEGAVLSIPYKGSIVDILNDIEGGLRSSMSYVNAHSIREFQENADFVEVTVSTRIENGPVAQ